MGVSIPAHLIILWSQYESWLETVDIALEYHWNWQYLSGEGVAGDGWLSSLATLLGVFLGSLCFLRVSSGVLVGVLPGVFSVIFF